jgi:acyl carrier protein phosphodiesterase
MVHGLNLHCSGNTFAQMNYLAHCYLAFGNPDLLAGQFIADDVKGRKFENFPESIKRGILLHRFVDHFTDTWPGCLEIRAKLRPQLGLFSGIALDVFFDHILALEWDTHSELERSTFIQKTYDTLSDYEGYMTEKRKFLFHKMVEADWLGRYDKIEGISLTLTQMSRRIPGGEILLKASDQLEENKKFITEVFKIFFPQLIYATQTKLDTFAP